MPKWNQIHIVGVFSDTDSAARGAAMNSYLRQMNTENVDWAAFHASLAVTHPKDELAHELFELAVR
jgi:hypothetical protein